MTRKLLNNVQRIIASLLAGSTALAVLPSDGCNGNLTITLQDEAGTLSSLVSESGDADLWVEDDISFESESFESEGWGYEGECDW